MTEKVVSFLKVLRDGEYKAARREEAFEGCRQFDEHDSFAADAFRLNAALCAEEPYILPHDIFGFNRTVINEPAAQKLNNIVPKYRYPLEKGFDGILADVRAHEPNDFYRAIEQEIASLYAFCDRYKEYAEKTGHDDLARALCVVPRQAPTSFYEACLMMKIIIFALRHNCNHHITLGRFDQYTYPYFKADLDRGEDPEKLFEILELFFISLNLDSDLYTGVQQGDNGQSMVIGGYGLDGSDQYNELSEMIIRASCELKLIDPKINLRVNRTTPIERYEFATQLTKCGLGFPQYCNDDIVIPGLIKIGYAPEDAADYAVAACWEFITSGKAYDVVNSANINLPDLMNKAVENTLPTAKTFEEFKDAVFEQIRIGYEDLMDQVKKQTLPCSPFLSVFVDDCIARGKDISEGGAIYNNCGILTSGIATVADSLAAVKKLVFEEKSVSAGELLDALHADFVGYDKLRNTLLNCPKMGDNDDYVDALGCELLETMSKSVNGKPNHRGGVFRGSTGSAQGYITRSKNTGATPDGRKAYTPYASSFTPALEARISGPLSIIQSFTKYDLMGLINGGPLTLEIHDTVFRNEDGIKKTAALVKAFIARGGHQLQLNAINHDLLLDAKAHPENHKNLIVRVWGWSGYFNELDPEYQNHIIARTEYVF